MITGFAAVALGVLGIFLPLLPTVPLLLLALACFARSSERFYSWLVNHARLGPLIQPYLDARGIPRASKYKVLALLWASIILSAALFVELAWVRALLLVIALAVTFYLVRLPELETDEGS